MTREGVTLSLDDLRKLYLYALDHCKELCPAIRDAETCVIMVELGRILGIEPPCVEDFGGFDEETFERLVDEIEERYGKSLPKFLAETEERGPRSLQEQADVIDGKFALEVLAVLKRRKNKNKENKDS